MKETQNKKPQEQPKTIQASFELKQSQQGAENTIDLNKDPYYLMAKENFFYLQNLMNETNRYGNDNYHKLSERLFTSATIILGFAPVILSFLQDNILDSQIWLLSISICLALLSIIFGFVDHYLEKNFWENTTEMLKKQTGYFDSTLSKMRNDPNKTSQFHKEAIVYIAGMDQCSETKSKIWAQVAQFIAIISSMVSIIICYFISIPS